MKVWIAGLVALFGVVSVQAEVVFSDDFDGSAEKLNGHETTVGGYTWADNFSRADVTNDHVEVSVNNQMAVVTPSGLTNEVYTLRACFQMNDADLSGGFGGAYIGMGDGAGQFAAATGDAIVLSLNVGGTAADQGKLKLSVRESGTVKTSQLTDSALAGYDSDPVCLTLSYDLVNWAVSGTLSNTVSGASLEISADLGQAVAEAMTITKFGINTIGLNSGTAIWDDISLEQSALPPEIVVFSDDFNGASESLNGHTTTVGGYVWADFFSRALVTNDHIEVSVNNQKGVVTPDGLANDVYTLTAYFDMNGADLTGAYGGAYIGMSDGNNFLAGNTIALSVTVGGETDNHGKLQLKVFESGSLKTVQLSAASLAGYDTDLLCLTLSYNLVNWMVNGTLSNTVSGTSLDVSTQLDQETAAALSLSSFGINTYGWKSGTAVWDDISLQQTASPSVSIGTVSSELAGAGIVFTWQGDVSGTYALQTREDLTSGDWSNVVENISGVNGTMVITNEIAGSQAFYRLIGE